MTESTYLRKGPVIVSFVGGKPYEIAGSLLSQNDHHIVVQHEGLEKVIPWTAIGAVMNTKAR